MFGADRGIPGAVSKRCCRLLLLWNVIWFAFGVFCVHPESCSVWPGPHETQFFTLQYRLRKEGSQGPSLGPRSVEKYQSCAWISEKLLKQGVD